MITHAPRRIIAPVALVALLALSLAGCRTARAGKAYQDPNMDFGALRTVAVLPFTNLSRDNLAGERVRDVFASALLASGAVYVVPYGEVVRALGKAAVVNAAIPSTEEVTKLGTALKADGVIVGVVKEYGEVRSGAASGNVVSMSIQLVETATGRVVWSGASTKGGISMSDRLLGSGGTPINVATEAAVDDILEQMFK